MKTNLSLPLDNSLCIKIFQIYQRTPLDSWYSRKMCTERYFLTTAESEPTASNSKKISVVAPKRWKASVLRQMGPHLLVDKVNRHNITYLGG